MSTTSGHAGRTDDEWDELVTQGRKFLIEQARLGRTTTYTELNAALGQRSTSRPFDFSSAGERAAMGQLLCAIVEQDRPDSDVLISAIVLYLNENDAGSGFYSLAESHDLLPTNSSKSAKEAFWAAEVARVHQHYRRKPRR
jgi:hypothetical protein